MLGDSRKVVLSEAGERRRQIVFVRQRCAARAGVVGVEGDWHAAVQQGSYRVLLVAGGGSGLYVACKGDLKGDAVFGQVIHQPRVFGRPDTVSDPFGAKVPDRVPRRFRSGGFAGVGGQAKTGLSRAIVGRGEIAGGVAGFVASDVDRAEMLRSLQGRIQLGERGVRGRVAGCRSARRA